MLINGIDITSLNIKLYDRILTSNTVKAVNEWADGSLEPYYVRSQDTFKKMTLTFLVLEPDEQEAFLKMSQLTQMLKKATIKFDDLDFQFDVVFNGTNKPSRLKNGNFLITYDLASGYARSLDREVYTTDIGATSTFRLNVVYYQNGNIFAGQDTVLIRSVSFSEQETPTLSSIGIDVDKFKDEHYKSGVASNLGLMELTYDNLQSLGVLIINYEPIQYSVEVRYIIDSGSGYQQSLQETIPFTYPQIQAMRSVGELIKVNNYRPEGYSAKILYNQGLIVENLLAASPIFVQYTHIEDDRVKNITLTYRSENDDGEYDIIESVLVSVPETRIVEGTTFEDIFNFDAWRPTPEYYHPGYIDGHSRTDFVNYDELETSYYIDYRRIEYVVYIEYYAGIYPNWYRLATSPILLKYNSSYEEDFSLENIGIDLDKYLTGNYQNGVLYNAGLYHTFDSVIEAGALRVYYVPIEYPLTVRYKKDDSNLYTEETININITQFYNQPLLGDIVDITGHKPTGYQFDPEASYKGEVSLDALTYAQPIYIIYTEIQTTRTKDIIIRYKQQLASAFSTISTAIITVSENELIGGARLKDIIDLNAHQPEYYETGILDGVSDSQVITFETLATSYSVLYYASTYYTVINYYTDDVDVRNWVGSDTINYRVIDFSADTTLIDLGLKINQYKNVFAADGIVQYRGPVNFTALRELTSIDIVYDTVSEPDEPGDIEYPHRVLFLQHNDLGGYEGQHPNWRFPHAYINTGFTCEDMSKLTVKIKCGLVDEYTPMSQVNAGYAYLFGSSSSFGEYFMRFNNQTMYGTNLSGVNTYEARAGQYSAPLVLTESNAIGWGPNSGIYSNPSADGYSVAVFNYSNRVATDHARMPFPLYLFANNNAGAYTGGLAGIEIYNCIIEYDGEVVRDFIPVQYYDKIGSQVAPSNCLYDKVSQSFFEDATGQNSFNIRDDDSYPITDPVQQIGSFYVNYYKGDYIFETRQIFYRGDEFEEEWDLDAKLEISEHQPIYYNPGQIVNLTDLGEINFENLKNFVFNVVYEEQENVIQVRYYKDTNDPANLLATESLVFTEKDFYQVPMFGELIRLNKYKPEGYETNYVFPEPKTTLGRVIAHAPYDIVYTPIEGEEPTYTTNIKYIKKVFGFHTYETLGNITLTLGASDFREGEFIDYYIDWDALKPEKYYLSGESYQWYKMDEHLYSPSKLKNEYIICYLPTTEQIEVRYYTDDVDILNQVATTTWSVRIDDFDGPFYLVDQLPNRYVNLFKPVKCDYGVLQNTNKLYTFDELVEAGIDIVYDTIIEPGGPDAIPLNRLNKVLFWDARFGPNNRKYRLTMGNQYDPYIFVKTGGRIPYIDLGYTPKELSRLTVEMKYVSKSATPMFDIQNPYSGQTLDYMGIFGYAAAFPVEILGDLNDTSYRINNLAFDDNKSTIGRYGTGTFALRGRVPIVRMPIVYNEYTPATWEGEKYSTTYRDTKDGALVAVVIKAPRGITKWNSSCATYRNGASTSMDENFNTVKENSNYEVQYNASIGERMSQSSFFNDMDHGSRMEVSQHALDNGFTQFDVAVPITHTLSAYRQYSTAYDFGSGNGYGYYDFSDNDDKDSFEVRCHPRGSLTLFATRNPDSGIINQNPFCHMAYPNVSGALSSMHGLSIAMRQNFLNPYYAYNVQRTIETDIILENLGATNEDIQYYTAANGQVIPMSGTNTQTIKYSHSSSMYVGFAGWQTPAEPEPTMCMVWSIKIWDRDKLVRDLVPVAKGEEIAGQIMPENGLFDLITEIFFTNCNEGGTYIGTIAETHLKDGAIMPNGILQQGDVLETSMVEEQITIPASDVIPLMVMDDPCYFGNVGANYYDEQNNLIAQQSVAVPVWYDPNTSTFAEQLHCNDFKPNDYYLNGLIDTDDPDNPYDQFQLKDIYEQGLINIYYRYRSFSKSVVYYNDNMRIGSRDLFFNLHDIEQANSITDLPIEIDLYKTSDFTNGRLIFNDTLLANNDMAAFLDAPAPVVVYDKYTKLERPDLFYVEYYRGGASEDNTITLNIDPNYLDCNLTAKVLNPTGTTKYQNHYHQAYYEDEPTDYFLPYQARINNPYVGIHYGPARRYRALAYFVHKDEVITIMEERNGWGRLKEYYHGWILLSAIDRIQGPGQNPDYDPNTELDTTIPFGANLTITKLTVDRLWAYASNYDCWVKVEELSLNQSGKLYNAIGLDVIHLDEVDWNDVYILQDIVDIQKKKLRYHEFATVNHTGTITYNDMVDLHELDIVYPETIYHYNIHYYYPTIDESCRLGAAMLSCSIGDWNPDWDHFIETSWQTNDQGEEILPELYRAAPVSLSWDFFGVGKNLFNSNHKYPDGIFLWNPHPWDDEHIYFTFEELVRTGTQKVLYPLQPPRLYKYYNYPIKSVKEGFILGPPTGYDTIEGVVFELEEPFINNPMPTNNNYPDYGSITFNGLTAYNRNEMEYIPIGGAGIYYWQPLEQAKEYYYWNSYSSSMRVGKVGSNYFFDDDIEQIINPNATYTNSRPLLQRLQNIYNNRKENGLWGIFKREDRSYYRFYRSPFSPYPNTVAKIPYDNSRLPKYLMDTNNADTPRLINSTERDFYDLKIPDYSPSGEHANGYARGLCITKGIYHGIKFYDRNNNITAYYVPNFAGHTWMNMSHSTMPFNVLKDGFFDIINPYREDGSGKTRAQDPEREYGKIYLQTYRSTINENPMEHDYNYYDDRPSPIIHDIPTTPPYTFYKTSAEVWTYNYPNEIARARVKIPSGMVVPAEDYAYVDRDNTVEYITDKWCKMDGKWYKVKLGVNTSNPTDATGITEYTPTRTDIVLRTLNNGFTPFITAIIPSTNNDIAPKMTRNLYSFQTSNHTKEVVRVCAEAYFSNDDTYYYLLDNFDCWICHDDTYIDRIPVNQLYVVANDSINYYEYPIKDANDTYKLGRYLAGDRVYITEKTKRDTNWLRTAQGWVYYEDNNLVLVE